VQLLARFGQLVYTQVAQLSLVARGDRTVLYTRHILDSLNPSTFIPPPPSALDIEAEGDPAYVGDCLARDAVTDVRV